MIENMQRRIRAKRKSAGYSKAEFAQQLQVKEEDVRKWESGEKEPSLEDTRRICECLGCSADYLLNCQGQQPLISEDTEYEELIDSYRKLDWRQRRYIRSLLQAGADF